MPNFVNAEYEERDEEDEGGEEEEFSDEDDDPEEEVLQQVPRPNAVYNSVALHEKLEEIGWPEDIDWMHALSIDYPVEGEIDVNDDLAREMAFYTQALEGTREAYTKLLQSGTPFLRPPDYYAEMVKSDSHMLKVKDKLLSQQKQMEEAEERRKARESKRFSKEVQAQKLKQRAQEKKQNIESVKKWRKMRQDGDFDGGEDDFPLTFDDDSNGDGGRGSKKRKSTEAPKSKPFKKFKGSGHGQQVDSPATSKSFGASPGRDSRNINQVRDQKNDNSGPRNKRNINAAPWDRSGGKAHTGKPGRKARTGKPGKGKAFQKRQSRDAKYGHGGKKSLKKVNTAESSAGVFRHKQRKGKS